MKTSKSIQELLEQNARWWERASAYCESMTPLSDAGKKEELLLMSAVYQERADIHERLLEQLRRGESIAPVIPRERERPVQNGPGIAVTG